MSHLIRKKLASVANNSLSSFSLCCEHQLSWVVQDERSLLRLPLDAVRCQRICFPFSNDEIVRSHLEKSETPG